MKKLMMAVVAACAAIGAFGEYAAGLDRRHCYGYKCIPTGYTLPVSGTDPIGPLPPDIAATDLLSMTGAGGTMKGTVWTGEIYLENANYMFKVSGWNEDSITIGGRVVSNGNGATGVVDHWPAGWYPVEIRHNAEGSGGNTFSYAQWSKDGASLVNITDDGSGTTLRHLVNAWDVPAADVLMAPKLECKPTGVIYLKADATGDGTGTSWANACTDLAAAFAKLDYANGVNAIFVAAGIYHPSSLTLPVPAADGVAIYGGFRGDETGTIAEMLAARDPAANEVIFSADVKNAAKWVHRVPNIESDPSTENPYGFVNTTLDVPIVDANGKFVPPPAYTGDYDCYYAGNAKNANFYGQALTIPATPNPCLVDGVTFLCYTTYAIVASWGGNYIASCAQIRNCRFIGNNIAISLSGCEPPISPEISNCAFKWASEDLNTTPGQVYASRSRSAVMVRGCVFESIARSGSNGGGNAISVPNSLDVRDCDFVRCQTFNTLGAASEQGNNVRASTIGATSSSFGLDALVSGCVFSNCLAASANDTGTVIAGLQYGTFARCLFRDNLELCRGIDGRGHVLVGAPGAGSPVGNWKECAFECNEIRAVDTDGTGGSYALGIVGNGKSFSTLSAIGCTFVSNVATRAEAAGDWTLSAGFLSLSSSAADLTGMAVAHCTFVNDDLEDVVDVAAIGEGQTLAFPVVNSIFQRPSPYQAVKASVPGIVSLVDCTVAWAPDLPEGVSASGLERDAMPLERAETSGGRLFVLRPAAYMPGLRTTADFSTNLYHHAMPNFRYRPRGGETWVPLTASTPLDTYNAGHPDADAAGTVREFGDATRGAAQALGGGAETGKTLVIRGYPEGLGSIGGAGPVQVVAEGGVMQSVTAVPPEGSSFLGWYEGDDLSREPFSTSATLTSYDLANRTTVLTARFTAPQVEIEFDLGAAGVFVQNNQPKITVTVEVGSPFPEPPTYVENDGWLIEGFKGLPSKATEPVTCAVSAITRSLRIIYVVPKGEVPAGSDGTGEGGWQNATDDFPAAYANAGRYRGEVWMKGGRYLVKAAMTALANVTVRGGFAGDETSADAADPVRNRTVITGDVNDDDAWTPSGGKIWDGTAYNEVTPDLVDVSIYKPTKGSDDTASFLLCAAATTNIVFSGVDIACFGRDAFCLVGGSDLALERCRVLAGNSALNGGNTNHGVIDVPGGRVTAKDCLFHGMMAAISLASSGTESNSFVNCRFANLTHTGYRPAVQVATTAKVTFEDCTFDHNYTADHGWSHGPFITVSKSDGVAFIRCAFTDNKLGAGTCGNILIADNPDKGKTVFKDCVFRGNRQVGVSNAMTDWAKPVCINATIWADVLLDGCLFEGNWLDATGVAADQAFTAADVRFSLYAKLRIVNCRLGGFSVSNSTANCTATELWLGSGDSRGKFAAVHSVVEAPDVSGDVAEISAVSVPLAEAKENIAFINSVVDGRGQTALALPAANFNAAIASSLFTELDVENLPKDANGYVYDVRVGAVPYAEKPAVDPENAERWLPVLRGGTPEAKLARKVYRADDGEFYFYDAEANAAKPWRKVLDRTSYSASVAGLEYGVTPPIADAFGAPRKTRRYSIGPVNANPTGFAVLVK